MVPVFELCEVDILCTRYSMVQRLRRPMAVTGPREISDGPVHAEHGINNFPARVCPCDTARQNRLVARKEEEPLFLCSSRLG
jgi:hypothetical protein